MRYSQRPSQQPYTAYAGWNSLCIPDSHPHRIISTKSRINKVVSPDDCLVCSSICSCIPDSHPYRITSTKCRTNTVVFPDDGPIFAEACRDCFDVLLTVRLSIFILVFNQLDTQNLFYNKFYFMPIHVSSTYRCDDTRDCVMQF